MDEPIGGTAPRRPALIFIFVTVLLDMLALGMMIPVLPKLVVAQIVSEFGGLDELLAATDAELEVVEGVGELRAKDIREGLRRLQEINLVDRYLQT